MHVRPSRSAYQDDLKLGEKMNQKFKDNHMYVSKKTIKSAIVRPEIDKSVDW